MDAPLIVKNASGMRLCERLVGRYFHRHGIGCHALNVANLAFTSVTEPSTEQPRVDRVRLESLRYAVNDGAVSYIAIMRTFTTGLSGLLSD